MTDKKPFAKIPSLKTIREDAPNVSLTTTEDRLTYALQERERQLAECLSIMAVTIRRLDIAGMACGALMLAINRMDEEGLPFNAPVVIGLTGPTRPITAVEKKEKEERDKK